MNWVWLVINSLFILSAITSGSVVDFVITLGEDSSLGLVGAITVLITPFIMAIYLKKYRNAPLLTLLLILNVVSLVYSADVFLNYFKPSDNSMWLLAVSVPLVWLIGAGSNLFIIKNRRQQPPQSKT